MKIFTLVFPFFILCKVLDAKVSVDINLLESITKAIDPYHKQLHVFKCWHASELLQKFIKHMNSNSLSVGFHEISIENLPYHPKFVMSTILLDLSCPGATSFWQNLNLEFLFSNKIILVNVETAFYKIVANQKGMGFASEVYLLEQDGLEKVVIKKVRKREFNSIVKFETFAIWFNNTLTIVKPKLEFIPKERYNLQGASIRICIVIPSPATMDHLTDGVDRHIDTNTKHGAIVTHELLEFLNAVAAYTYVTTWGYYNKSTGNWTGLIHKLMNNEADIGGTQVFVTESRVSIIHYAYKTSTAVTAFVFQNPRLSITDNLFLLPFSQVTWICVLLLIPILASSITLIQYFAEWKVLSNSARNRQSHIGEATLGESFYMVLTIACQQGFTYTINSLSTRLLLFFSLLTLMLIYVSYAASIVALLQSSKRINTLQDLLESKMKLGVADTLYNRIYFPMQTEPTKKAIYERKIVNRDGTKNFLPAEVGVQKVRDEVYAFHAIVGNAYRFISNSFTQNEKCRLNTIIYLNMDPPYHLIRKNATFKEIVTVGLSRINEHGILKRVSEPFYAQKPTCTGSSVKFFAITIHDVLPAFLLLGYGYAISLFLFTIEIIADKYQRKKHSVAPLELQEMAEIE